MPSDAKIDVAPASNSQKATIAAFLDQYLAEFGYPEPYPCFDAYWSDPRRFPFLIYRQGVCAGFAFIRYLCDEDEHEMAEFYVLPEFRESGVGRAAVVALLATFPGRWKIPVHSTNHRGLAFWSRVLGGVPKPGSGEIVVFSYGG